MLVALKHNLTQLFVFSGRTRPLHFWLYTAVIMLAHMALGMIGGVLLMQEIFGRLSRVAREHPEDVVMIQTPSGTSWHIEGNHPELMPNLQPVLITLTIVALVTTFLMAAAVTRRLHDSNRRGWWGLLPLPVLATGLAVFPMIFSSAMAGGEPDMSLILLLFANNLVYLISLGVLIALLCFSGTRGENRFGPPPV